MMQWIRFSMAVFSGKGRQVFMAAIFAFHAGKSVMEINAIEVAVYHLLDIGLPKAVFFGKVSIINLNKRFKTVFDATIIIGVERMFQLSGGISRGDSLITHRNVGYSSRLRPSTLQEDMNKI